MNDFFIKKVSKPYSENLIHKVQYGETLLSICKKYNQTVNNIKKLNHLSSEKLYVGQLLYVDKVNKYLYVVKPADTLQSIATKFNTTTSYLMQQNNINQVFIGQQIVL